MLPDERSRNVTNDPDRGRRVPAHGEQTVTVMTAMTRPNEWLVHLVSPLLLALQRPWFVVLTDRRVLVVAADRLTDRPIGIEWDEPLHGVQVDRYRPGLLSGKLFLRRVADGRVLRLRFTVVSRSDAQAIAAALGHVADRRAEPLQGRQ